MLENIAIDTLVTGLPLIPVVLAVFVVLRIREDFDLTIEGSFALGGSVAAILIAHDGNPFLAVVAGAAAGAAAGLVTSAITLAFRLPVLLAGLLMTMFLFSVSLRVLDAPTVSLAGHRTVFSGVADGVSRQSDLATCGVLAVAVIVMLAGFAYFLRTDMGLALRASGANVRMVRSHGVSDRWLLVVSLVMANALSAFGGCLMVQVQGYGDVNMGSGVFLAGVGAVLLGVLIMNPGGSQVMRIAAAVLIGGLLYRLILVAALRAGLSAGDLKAVTALTLIIAVAAQSHLVPLVRKYANLWRPAPGSAHVATEEDL